MKLITENSILKNLPLNLGSKHMLILDSLRFLLEMIDNSYDKLMKDLLNISKAESNRNTPEIFGYVWSIIDNTSRVVRIAKQLPWEYRDEILGHLYYVDQFRNTFQHLDERIEESLIKTQSPFVGVVTWVHKNYETSEIDLYQLISGNLVAGPHAEQTVYGWTDCKDEINFVSLHTVGKKANIIHTDIGVIINNLKRLVNEFEFRFRNLTPCDWSKRQDVILCLKTGQKNV